MLLSVRAWWRKASSSPFRVKALRDVFKWGEQGVFPNSSLLYLYKTVGKLAVRNLGNSQREEQTAKFRRTE